MQGAVNPRSMSGRQVASAPKQSRPIVVVAGLIVIVVGSVYAWRSYRTQWPDVPQPQASPAVAEPAAPKPSPVPQPTPEPTAVPSPIQEVDTSAAAPAEATQTAEAVLHLAGTDDATGVLELTLRPAAMATVDGFHVPDGGQRASGSHLFTGLSHGEHHFRVFRDGYTNYEGTVTIAAGRTSSLVVRLEPAL